MNKGFVTSRLLLALTLVALGVVRAEPGLAMSPPGSLASCGKLVERFAGRTSLIDYYAWLRSASSEEKDRQHNCADSVAKSGALRGKLVLALTLLVPDTPFADFSRAKTILAEYLRVADHAEPEDKNLALLLLAMLDEIARLEEQLDQLKAIEKNITETEKSVNVPTPAPEPSPVVKDELEKKDTAGR